MGNILEFDSSPDPKTPAPARRPEIPRYDDDQKKGELVSFRAPYGTKAYIQHYADEAGVPTARLWFSLLEAHAAEQALSCQHCEPPHMIAALNRTWSRAWADHRLSLVERFGLLRLTVDFCRWLLSGVRHLREVA